jgi:hypothetical protein
MKGHDNRIGLFIYVPILLIFIIIFSIIAISLVVSKRSQIGGIDLDSGSGSLIHYISSANYGNILTLDTSYSNRVVYVSGDKANLTNQFGIQLFDPVTVTDGTSITIFNSPSSNWPTLLTVSWAGAASTGEGNIPNIDVSLGTGQGVTCITQRRIGSHFLVSLGGTTFDPPDLTPGILQQRDWVVYKYWDAQNFCTSINNVANGTNWITDQNEESPCYGLGNNSGIGSEGNVSAGTNCVSKICQCPNNPEDIWPPPASAWCNI